MGDFNDWMWPGSVQSVLAAKLPAPHASSHVPRTLSASEARSHLLPTGLGFAEQPGRPDGR